MIDLVRRMCEEEGCTTRPSFGYADDGVALRCRPHILPGELLVLTGNYIWPLYDGRPESDKALRCQTGLISYQARAVNVKGCLSLVAK